MAKVKKKSRLASEVFFSHCIFCINIIIIGVGIPGGCDTAVHCVRRFRQSLPAGHVMVKLDFAYAFNSLHRRDMLLALRDSLPE